MNEYDKEVARRYWRMRSRRMGDTVRNVADMIGGALLLGMFACLAWMWLTATPAQANGDGETESRQVIASE